MSIYRRLTPHFSYKEMTHTEAPTNNTPDDWCFHNLCHLCFHLEAIRSECGFPLLVTSGYRSPETNLWLRENKPYAVAEHSYHLDGRACDIAISHLDDTQRELLFNAVEKQLPTEFIIKDTIIHIAF